MEFTEEESNNLKATMLHNGFETYDTDFFDSSYYRKLRNTMLDTLNHDIISSIDFKLYPKSEIIKAGRYVLDKHFNGIDMIINYTEGCDLTSELYSQFGDIPSENDYDLIIKYINDNIKKIDVRDIPVELRLSNDPNGGGTFDEWFFSSKNISTDLINKIPYSVSKIYLSGKCNEFAKTIYVHEMMHALTNRNKGIVKNLLLNEMLSIFMEKVAAYDLDDTNNLLDLTNFERLIQTKHSLMKMEYYKYINKGYEDLLCQKTYFLSTLYATGLFDLYLNGDDKLKTEIDESVSDVITGKLYLEDMINKYNLSYLECSKIIQDQCKKYTKKYITKKDNI